jgi:CRISPR-associated protein Csx10
MDKRTFTAKLTMLSDWHIGSGAGITGDIDSLVQKDRDGLPYIPAKTLTGIWRDACELVAFGLDNSDENGVWHYWVNYLFGEQPAIAQTEIQTPPRPAALSIRPAYFSEQLRQALNQKPGLKNAITFVKPGISLDPEAGLAMKNFLRFEEVVRSGAILEAECELNLLKNQELDKTAYALLIAGTKLVERLGGKRRRGAGRCQLEVEDIKPLIKWIEQHPTIKSPPVFVEQEPEINQKSPVINQSNEWVEVKLRITTKSPVIIAKRTIGNLTETIDYIPGTHLLRFISRKLGHFGLDLNQAIASGSMVMTNATLEINEQKSRPVPLALFYEKLNGGLDKQGNVHNRLVEFKPAEQLKGYRTGYVSSVERNFLPEYQKITTFLGTHNTIKDELQRPTSDLGGIYSYEAIKSETRLIAEFKLTRPLENLLTSNKADWYKSLEGKYRVGQSKKDDYGEIFVEFISKNAVNSGNSLVVNPESPELTLWLLSDVLLRDERLRPTTDISYLIKELETHLNVQLKIKSSEDEKISFIARTNRLDSWQVRWGLPRPSLVGIAAGSCIVLQVTGKIAQDKLTWLSSRGIGERRAEGYGQICFNDILLVTETSKLQVSNRNNSSQNPNSAQLLELGKDSYARSIEKAAWRDMIQKVSLSLASERNFRAELLGIVMENNESKPPISQLGSLRSVLTQLQKPSDNSISGWIQILQNTPNRFEKWPNGSLDKLRALTTIPDRIWEILAIKLTELGHKNGFSEFTLTQTGERELREELWSEAVRITIDECIRAHKHALEKDPNITQTQGAESYGA